MQQDRLLDRLVSNSEQHRRHRNSQRSGSLQIYTQHQPRGLLDRELARLCAFQDAVHVAGGPPILVGYIWPVRHQATCYDEVLERIDGGQLISGRQIDDQLAMNNGQTVGRNDQSTVRLARELDDPTLNLRRVLQTYRADLRHSDSAR